MDSAAASRPDGLAFEQMTSLGHLLYEPTRYTQRFVERLSFLPTGGQSWARTLQIRIPAKSASPAASWWIVPLGHFDRRRLADIEVTNANGSRLTLLTRNQHGLALTETTALQYISAIPEKYAKNLQEPIPLKLHHFLRGALYRYFTSLDRIAGTDRGHLVAWLTGQLGAVIQQYERLLNGIGMGGTEYERQVAAFVDALVHIAPTTVYLCWVFAHQDEVVNLRASYTTVDPRQVLPLGSIWDALASVAIGWIPRASRSRRVRARWFRQYGLSPIDYAFKIPKYESTRSYYFTLEPPPHTTGSFLDWEASDSLREVPEVDSAYLAAHVHNAEVTRQGRRGDDCTDWITDVSGSIRAYLRCKPTHHKQILGAAALNIVVVWLLAAGRLPGRVGDPLQGLLVAAPSIFIAFLVQQQKHYYSNAMRRQRAMLWLYLVFCVGFLVAVAFSEREGVVGSRGLGDVATVAAWTMAVTSAGVLGWHLLLGNSYDRAIQYLTSRKWEVIHPKDGRELSAVRRTGNRIRRVWWKAWGVPFTHKWECYADAVRQYCLVILLVALTSMGCAVAVLCIFWQSAPSQPPLKGGSQSKLLSAVPSPDLAISLSEQPQRGRHRC